MIEEKKNKKTKLKQILLLMIKKQDTTTPGMGFSVTQQMLVRRILTIKRAEREESNQ